MSIKADIQEKLNVLKAELQQAYRNRNLEPSLPIGVI